MVQLTGLYVYPVKSARGIALREATLSDRGIQHDRRFMIVDGDGHFLSQRQLPVLARLETALEGGELTLSYEGVSISLPLAPPRGPLRRVRVWRDDVEALALAPEVDCFLSAALARPARLVYMPDETRRKVDPTRAGEQDVVGFADGYPYLLTNESSLAQLNTELATPVPMQRFRPNLVIAGAPAYAEDGFRELRVGALRFVALKPCSRCVIINTDHTTGARAPGPLEVLSRTHRVEHKPVFGQNLVARDRGKLQLGDSVVSSPGP